MERVETAGRVASAGGGWRIADIFEAIARHQPSSLALLHGSRELTWGDLDERANRLAHHLLHRRLGEQEKVAQLLHNGPEYLESVFAAFKIGLAVVNTNYRYTAEELVYLWSDADVAAVVFHGAFAETCAAAATRLPMIVDWLWVDDGSGPCPAWATPYEQAVRSAAAQPAVAPWGRSEDHMMLLYTGGTTGMPKGVMWRQHDLVMAIEGANRDGLPPVQDLDVVVGRARGSRFCNLAAAPLMHGMGLFNALGTLLLGGAVVTTEGMRFDPVEILDTVQSARITTMSIVGDAMAVPLLAVLDADERRRDISSLKAIVSSGVMWSAPTKQGLHRHNPDMVLVDTLGSSEAIGVGSSRTRAGDGHTTASFRAGPRTRVVDEDGRDVRPGSGEVGRLAVSGPMPVGYYKDPEKTAATFPVIDGVRYSIPGDLATIEADGTVRLLGRGSQCINTGGEKVFPEEVEEALKLHPDVVDAAVVGVPDDRFGQSVCAVVEPRPGASLAPAELVDHARQHLAGFKVPRSVVLVDSVGRSPNGKLDQRAVTRIAEDAQGANARPADNI